MSLLELTVERTDSPPARVVSPPAWRDMQNAPTEIGARVLLRIAGAEQPWNAFCWGVRHPLGWSVACTESVEARLVRGVSSHRQHEAVFAEHAFDAWLPECEVHG